MLGLRVLNPVENVAHPSGGTVRLTHACTSMVVNLNDRDRAMVVSEQKGYIDPRTEEFVGYGDPVVKSTDAKGLADLLADTTGGKPAGDFRVTDVVPAIEKRNDEIASEKELTKQAAIESEAAAMVAFQKNLGRNQPNPNA